MSEMKSIPKSILILKLGSLGDVNHTLPLANILRSKYLDAHIGWAIERKVSSLIENHPSVDEVIVFERKRGIKTFLPFMKFIKEVRGKKYDIIIDLQGNLKGGIITLLSSCRWRMGFKRGSSRIETISTFFTNRKVAEEGSHIIERNMGFAGELEADAGDISFGVPVEEPAKRYIDDFLKSRNVYNKRIVIMHPGVTWETKKWPIENYARLSEEIVKKFDDTAIVITAGPGEEKLAEKCRKGDVVIANGMNLSQLAALLDKCELFIGSDTGPLHLAAALGKRVIGLYGPTDPARNGPYGEKNFAVWKKLPCSGCWRRKCKSIKCMKEIEVSEVMGKVSTCLEETKH
jgi:lipopolysaccharide heptosyltransferase I